MLFHIADAQTRTEQQKSGLDTAAEEMLRRGHWEKIHAHVESHTRTMLEDAGKSHLEILRSQMSTVQVDLDLPTWNTERQDSSGSKDASTQMHGLVSVEKLGCGLNLWNCILRN